MLYILLVHWTVVFAITPQVRDFMNCLNKTPLKKVADYYNAKTVTIRFVSILSFPSEVVSELYVLTSEDKQPDVHLILLPLVPNLTNGGRGFQVK